MYIPIVYPNWAGDNPAPRRGRFDRLAAGKDRCYTDVMLRDRYFFPLCAAAAIAMIALALAGPWGANPATPAPSGQLQEKTQ